MRLYGAIQKIEPQDDGTVRVYGIATSEAVDEQGEIVRADAIRAAIPDYMRFPALREMHQLSAAGTTLEAEVCEDGTTRVVAHVVDPVAVSKVRNHVYRGFSIGGRVTQREAGDPKTITGLVLHEISLVDRPANPEAIFDCWKAAMAPDASIGLTEEALAKHPPRDLAQAPSGQEPFNAPIQIWACSIPGHRHLAKADALKCLKDDVGPAEEERASTVAAENTANNEGKRWSTEFRKDSGASGKSDRDIRYADPGYQSDGKKRYPIDSERHIRAAWSRIRIPDNAERYTDEQLMRVREEIIAAWKEKIGTEGPPSAEDSDKSSRIFVTKTLRDVSQISRVITDLLWLRNAFELETGVENDQLPRSARLLEIIGELCDFLSSLTTGEIGEIQDDAQTGGSPVASAMPGMPSAPPDGPDFERAAAVLQNDRSNVPQLAGRLMKVEQSRADQALLDMAHFACDQCLKIGGLSVDEKANMDRARHYLQQAGAMPTRLWSAQEAEDADNSSTAPEDPMSDSREVGIFRVLGGLIKRLCKRERAHQNLMDLAHECLNMLTDGAVCEQAAKLGVRHSPETTELLKASHRHLVGAGAGCDAAGVDVPYPPAQLESAIAGHRTVKANTLPDGRGDEAVLAKVLGEVVPMLERLSRRVDEIARTPLPPLTMAKGTVAISKQQDRESNAANGDPELSPDAIAAALAKMSKEEQTLTLIKASHATPIRILGSAGDQR